MNKEHKEKIQHMRKASADQNWESYQQALQSLVCVVNPDILLSLLIKYSRRFIMEFLQIRPELRDEYNQFTALEIGKVSERDMDDLYEQLESEKGKPGINSFRYAISNVSKLFNLEYCSAAYSKTFLTAVSNLFIAIPGQNWGTENPDLWYRWLRGTKTEDLLILARYYSIDPQKIEICKSLWNQLTDDIETFFTQIEHI